MSNLNLKDLKQTWPKPSRPRPIVMIGAGGIVNDAHLPAYKKAGFGVAGVFDVDPGRAKSAAQKWEIPKVFESIEQAFATDGAVFDVAVPPEHVYGVLQSVRPGSAVLIQKPMGKDLDDARRIRQICREKKLAAAVNFQLRFSPMMIVIRDALDRGLIGDILDLEFRLNLRTPWELFPFCKKLDRVEILIHSVHYFDLIRSFLGDPTGVYARTVSHPKFADFKSTRTSAILDYGDRVRCCLSLNHNFEFGPKHQAATVTMQGTKGAAVATLGLLLNYPKGEAETVELITEGGEWTDVPLVGRWFPDAFIGTMSNLQRFASGEDAKLVSSVEDAYKTMALVEACYTSNARGATPIPE